MEDWFEARENPPYSTDQQAEQMELALKDKLHKANAISSIEALIRNLCIYGNAAIKVDWDFGFDTIITKEPIYAQEPAIDPMSGQPALDPATGQPAMQPVMGMDGQPIVTGYQPKEEKIPKARPRITVIDVYDYLYDPDGAYEAHLTERTWREIQAEQEASIQAAQTDPTRQPMYFQEGLDQLRSRLANEQDSDEIIIRLAEFWNKNDNTWTIMTFGEDPEGISFKDLRASFRATAYSPYKRRVYGGESILLWDGDNPFYHKRSPILHTDFVKLPNEAFGIGAVEVISDLSESLNRFYNMIADNWNIGINHRYAYDINAEIDHESLNSFNVPGGKVGVVGKPQEVIFPLPQFTPATGDYQILEVGKSMIEMASGISDFYSKGLGGPAGNKTATGIQQIIGESNFRLKMFIRNLELDILQPLLEMCASMIQQFVDQPWSVSNPQAGVEGQPNTLMIDPKELIGTYQFNIVAANFATSKVVYQRQLLALAGVLEQSPYINPYVATRELLKAFQVKNIEQLLKSEQQVQQEQQAQQQQQLQMMLLQHQLETAQKVKVAEAKGPDMGPPGKVGHPRRKEQPEGKMPGSGVATLMRELGGKIGTNSLGLEGMSETPGGL
jgi:hypothetical protein